VTRARRAAASLVLCALAFGGLAAPCLADGGIGVTPAEPGGVDPVSNGFLVESLAPGATVSGAVVVSNSTAATTPASVYAADGITAVTTGVAFADDDQPPVSAGAWVTPAVTSVNLGPDSSQTVGFTVQVPADATPGDHVAAIVVQQAATPGGGSVSISQVVRGVVPIDVQVSGAAGEQAQLSAPTLGTLPGTTEPAVLVPIVDAGALMCRPTLAVTMTPSSGVGSTVTRQLDLLLPGDSITYPFAWPSPLSPGTYEITATVSGCGTTTSTHTTATVAGTVSTPAGGTPPAGVTAGAPIAAGTGPAAKAPAAGAKQSKPTAGASAPTATSTPTPTPAATAPVTVASPTLREASSPAVAATRAPHARRSPRSGPSGQGTGTAPALEPHPAAAAGRASRRTQAPATGPLATILRTARTVLTTTAFPLALLIVMLAFILLQDAIDRRDPKLSLASAYADPELSFGGDAPAALEPSGA